MSRAAPPRLARRLVRLLTPETLRDAVDGDLLEAFEHKAEGRGVRRARLWYWRQLASLDVLRLRRAHAGRVRPAATRGWRALSVDLGHDVVFAVRSLRRQPVFTLVALLTLAVGIGANTAVFSIVRGVLLRPLPYPDAHRVVMVFRTVPRFGFDRSTASYPDFADWRAGASGIARLAAYAPATITVQTPEGAERWSGYRATADLISVLGVRPALGRWFTDAEDRPGAPRVIVLSHALWQSRFGEDPAIAGRAVPLGGAPHVVVGVMPAAFEFPAETAQFWTPLRGDAAAMERDANFLVVVGRLAPGIPVSRAQADLAAMAARIDAEAPGANEGYGLFVEPRHAFLVRDARTALRLFGGAVVLVLLIAGANVASLLVTRGAARSRELAVRAALGAGRGRLARQLVTESAVLGLAGGALGFVVAGGLLRGLVALGAGQIPRLEAVRLDATMLGVTALVALGCGLALGVAGAWAVVRGRTMEGLREAATHGAMTAAGRRLQRGFVVVQVAVAVFLSLGAGLLVNSFIRLTNVQPGFDPAGLVAARVEPALNPEEGDTAARIRLAFYERVRERAAAAPGTDRATLAFSLPFGGHSFSRTFVVEGRDEEADDGPALAGNVVGADFFVTMGIPLRRGRAFGPADQPGAPPVTVISEAMANALWPGADPIGKRIRLGGPDNPWVTVVGVVGDVRQQALSDDAAPMFYRPVTQALWPAAMFVIVRSASPTAAAVATLRRVVRELDPTLPVTDVAAPTALIEQTVRAPRFRAAVLLAFGVAALLVAAAGVYGVMASSVNQRRRELGIRVALGAVPGSLVSQIVREGVVLAGIGLVVGIAGAVTTSRLVSGFLFGLAPYDITTYVVVIASVAAVTTIACYLPARRAAAADPLETMRAE
jgi:putative ABC transport system permease protein